MELQEMKEIINQYFDGELSKNEEVILFTQLSQNEESRNYFKEMNLLKSTVDETHEEYPQNMDQKIFSKIRNIKEQVIFYPSPQKIINYIGYALGIFVLILAIFFYYESVHYKDKLELTYRQVYQQNKMIQVLFNSLPQTEVRAGFANEIIVSPKM